jgi:DNA polymerase III delta subunit
MVISGNEHILRERNVRRAMRIAEGNGRAVQVVDGEDRNSLSACISGSVLFSSDSLVVVTHPEKADLSLLQAHQDSGDGSVCLVLHHEGKIRGSTKFGKMVKKLPSWSWLEFLEMPAHKAGDRAIKYVLAEAQRVGHPMSERLAKSLVGALGTDLGILTFEIRKAAAYADALGAKDLEAAHIKGTVAALGGGSVVPIMDAVGKANGAAALRAMQKLRKASTQDPTMLVVAWLQRNASQWLHAAALDSAGVPAKDAASQVGVPPFVYRNFILPVGKLWGEEHLVQLVKKVAGVERAVKTGEISPWLSLECVVLSCCRAVRRRG